MQKKGNKEVKCAGELKKEHELRQHNKSEISISEWAKHFVEKLEKQSLKGNTTYNENVYLTGYLRSNRNLGTRDNFILMVSELEKLGYEVSYAGIRELQNKEIVSFDTTISIP